MNVKFWNIYKLVFVRITNYTTNYKHVINLELKIFLEQNRAFSCKITILYRLSLSLDLVYYQT